MIKDLRLKIQDLKVFILLIFNLLIFNLSIVAEGQDFGLELMKCRASLDAVIQEAELTRLRIQRFEDSRNRESSIFNLKSIMAQADAIGDAIERLREELKIQDSKIQDLESKNQKSSILNLESRFRRKITCIHFSIKALKAEIDKHLCVGTTI